MARDLVLALLSMMVLFGAPEGSQGPTSRPPEDPPARLVPDNGGPFQELVLHYAPQIEADVAPSYRDLLQAFDSRVTVWVAVETREHFSRFKGLLERWRVGRTSRFKPVVVGRPITTWSRDRYSLLRQGDRRVLLVRPRPHRGPEPRVNDWQVPFALARAVGSDVTVRKAELIFDGGDLIATDQFVFATSLLMARNAGGSLSDPRRLARWLGAQTGREPVLLGREPDEVPPHHIGMFLTPLGDGVVLVGDPLAGLTLLPKGARLPRPVARDSATLARFQGIARDLRELGFTVKGVPLVPLSDGLTYVTYNNALLERRADGRLHAYVPQFGIATLDAAGRAAYVREGVVVHPVDVSRIYRHNGTVRCLVNVLRRGE
jgi:hypothetical protein